MKSNFYIFTKESLPYVGYSFLAIVIFSLLDLEFFAFLSFVFMLFSAYVFRNPQREYIEAKEKSLFSPVDGTITKVEELNDNDYAYKVVIDSGYLDVSYLRVPVNAKVSSIKIQRGTRTSKNSKLFDDLNENIVLDLIDTEAHEIKITHRLKQSFAPLMIDVSKDDELIKLSRYGVMLSGVTELYLPKDFHAEIVIGAKVFASQTVLGHF